MSETSERKTAAASYLIQFYTDIQQLTDFYSQYYNAIIELESKYKQLEGLTEEDRRTLIQINQNLRYMMHKCYIAAKTIFPILKIKKDQTLAKLYKDINADLIMSRDKAEQYVTYMNKVLFENVIKDLLESSSQFMDKLYNND